MKSTSCISNLLDAGNNMRMIQNVFGNIVNDNLTGCAIINQNLC